MSGKDTITGSAFMMQTQKVPAMMMHVTTGVSSRDKANANTPPTDLVSPNLANSRTNCIAQQGLYELGVHTRTTVVDKAAQWAC